MNRNLLLGLVAAVSIFSGLFFFCTYQEWLIISWHPPLQPTDTANSCLIEKKKVQLTLWKQGQWYQETVTLLWGTTEEEQVKSLTAQWLTLAYEEQCIKKRISVESALSSITAQDLYLSLSDTLFEKKWPTDKKMHLIEGLLKTLRDNGITTAHIFFLVHHQPLVDTHLDFSRAWPIKGFLNQPDLS